MANKKQKTKSKKKSDDNIDLVDRILAIESAIQKPVKTLDLTNLSAAPVSDAKSFKQEVRNGVDFNAEKTAFRQLSIINLFAWLFAPFLWLMGKLHRPKQPQLQLATNGSIEDIFAPNNGVVFFGLKLPKKWYKSAIVFVLLAFLIVLPLQAIGYYQKLQADKDEILTLSQQGFNSLLVGQDQLLSFQMPEARESFFKSKNYFLQADKKIYEINWLVEGFIKLFPKVNKTFSTGNKLLAAGQIFANIGSKATELGIDVTQSKKQNYYLLGSKLVNSLQAVNADFIKAEKIIKSIDDADVPENFRNRFIQAKSSLPEFSNKLAQALTLSNGLLDALGRGQEKTYLFVFANNNELRGVGGFMGSFAVIKLDQGEIKDITVPAGGTYDVQGQLAPKVIAPAPLQLINDRWEFQDANWWPDYPTSAKKIQWFYQNAGGPSSDGVFLLTATMMSRLISVIGPIGMPDYNITVTDKNFIDVTQQIIRDSRDSRSNRPKQFLTDLAPIIMSRFQNLKPEQYQTLISVLQQGLNEKELVIYFNDSKLENIVTQLGWAGQTKDTDADYLSIVQTNLAGGKTDQVIEQKITHQASVETDGTIFDTVTLTRIHHGVPGENIFTGVQNNSYVRFYVPLGSQLISVTGFEKPAARYFQKVSNELVPDIDLQNQETNYSFEKGSGTDIYQESKKTVFGNWLMIRPGQTKTVVIKYKLPFKLNLVDNNLYYYSLLTQKQSGALNTSIDSTITLADNYSVLETFPKNLNINDETVIFNAPLTTDQYYSLTINKK